MFARTFLRGVTTRRTLHSSTRLQAIPQDDLFMFDLEGVLVVKNVFSKEEVSAANAAIDAHQHEVVERKGILRNTKRGTPLSGDGKTGRCDMGGMLEWPSPQSDVFRSLLAHPKLVPYFHTFLGKGYRMDHLPLFISQTQGAEGFALHGGPVTSDGEPDFALSYTVRQGRMRNSLVVASLQLTDVAEGEGGFCVLRGSHKSNFAVPETIVHGDRYPDRLFQPATEAGDVVFFTEAAVHGTLPWTAEHERRAVLYRFAPGDAGYGRSYHPRWPEEMYEGMSEAQQAVLEPPYNSRLDRPFLEVNDEGQVTVQRNGRIKEKKEHDKKIFKSEYF